jgi:SAM-dependent methyltransferase
VTTLPGSPFRQRLETYLGDETVYRQPKEITKALAAFVEASGITRGSLVDVGCATGEMLHHFRQRFPGLHLTGIDTSDPFLEQARRVGGLAGVRFEHDDGLTFSFGRYQDRAFDIVVCSGMLSIFDDPEPLLMNLIRNTRRGGRVYVASMFNDDDIDVLVRYRDNRHAPEDWKPGHNVHATATIERLLRDGVTDLRFHPFEMPFELPRRPDYPHRAWTMQTADGRRLVVNGLTLINYEKILEITP